MKNDVHAPPKAASRLLSRFINADIRYAVLGDFEELYSELVRKKGPAAARLWYWSEVLKSLPSFLYDSIFWNLIMLKTHLKFALRNLYRHKGYTFLNVAGLAIGMASCLFILFYVLDELSYDRHHEHADQIYRVAVERQFPDHEVISAASPRPLGSVLVDAYPEILHATRLSRERAEQVLVRHKDNRFFEEAFVFADSNVFDVFTLPLIRGNSETVLKDPFSVVVTEATARKYFGSEDPIGKTLTVRLRGDGDFFDYQVTGLAREMPPQSHFHFDFLASYQLHPFATDRDGTERSNWGGADVYTYVLLQNDVRLDGLETKITEAAIANLGPQVEANLDISFGEYVAAGNSFHFFLQPLSEIHLHSDLGDEFESNGDATYVYFFSAIALFILLLACINFVNLSTARSTGRAKEVGIRKALGAHRTKLIRHYLTESMLLSFLALLVAVGLVVLLLPFFNGFTDKTLTLAVWTNWLIWPALLGFTLLVGLAAGAYPAFLLSGFRPAIVLQTGSAIGAGWSPLRKGLVVFQFTVTIALMVSTVVMYNQMNYLRSKKLGFDKEQVIVIKGTEILRGQTEIFRQALLEHPGMSLVAHAEAVPGTPLGTSLLRVEEASVEDGVVMERMYVGFDFIETLGIDVVSGRSLSQAFASDSMGVLLNESAVRALGIDDPIGKQLVRQNNNRTYTIVGIVKDFHFASLRQKIDPVAIFGPDPFYSNRPRQLFVARIQTDNLSEILVHLETTWKTFIPDQPLRYSFLNQDFDALYVAEQETGKLFGTFTVLALLIACLGLFGLASYTAEQRTKEIGVRKVLGASVPGIVWLLSKEFTKPIMLAFAIAAPIDFFVMNRWLQDFAYRTSVSIATLLSVGVLVLLFALLTVSYQALKAALANPVDSLQYD